MISVASALLANALLLLGLGIMTVAVYGFLRMPDIYNRLHAASKAVFLGVVLLVLASAATGPPGVGPRAVLLAVFLTVTTPVSAHAIGRAAYLERERMATPDAVDESGHSLPTSRRPKG